MPRLAKNTLTFPSGKRVHLDTVYPTAIPLKFLVEDIAAFGREAIVYKALFIRELSRMLAENGYDVNAEQMFLVSKMKVQNSQSLLSIKDYTVQAQLPENGQKPFEETESATRFKFSFEFTGEKFLDKYNGGKFGSAPLFRIDLAAIQGIIQAETFIGLLEPWKEWCAKDFMRMAYFAEHDYLHQIIDGNATKTDFLKSGIGNKSSPPIRTYTGDVSEDHAFALHAQILHRLFKASPKRKEYVLKYAINAYSTLAEIQKQAQSHCNNDHDKLHKVQEAITYFAGIYSHRFFRVISPEDPELNKKLSLQAGQEKRMSSVMDAMNELTLFMPEELLTAERGSVPANNLERLERLCAHRLNDTYCAIHRIDRFQVFDKTAKIDEITVEEISALEMVARHNEGAANYSGYRERYLQESAARAERMRSALALRTQGNHLAAARIEASLRQADAPIHGK